jgi:exodeoxyribonuclease V alpha subunit
VTVGVALEDGQDVQQVRRVGGLLERFNRAGVLGAADVHVALRLRRLGGEHDEAVLLAAALTVRAVRQGSVCLHVTSAQQTTAVDGATAEDLAALPWPDWPAWLAGLEASTLVAVGADGPDDRPLRLVDGLLYLDRYWRQERVIARYVDAAMLAPAAEPDADRLAAALSRLFPRPAPDRQRLAAVVAAHRRLSILAGGPGTGKTTTVAKLLALLQDQADGRLRVALAAPTGKAAARLTDAATAAAAGLPEPDRHRLGVLKASTLHRLLGSRPGARTRFRHDRDNRLPYDVVVVDEASMVSLTMMSRLVDALRPDARLVLVGDPDQLASVEVGAVLGDLVRRPAPSDVPPLQLEALVGDDLADLSAAERDEAVTRGVVRLSHVYRFSEEIRTLAEAIRSGSAEAVLAALAGDTGSVQLVDVDPAAGTHLDGVRADAVAAGVAQVEAARAGDAAAALAALDRHRLLCAHREGPYGVSVWGQRVEEWLAEAIVGYAVDGLW